MDRIGHHRPVADTKIRGRRRILLSQYTCRVRTLRIPGLLLIVGYLGLLAGVIGYSDTFPLSKQGWIEVLVEPVGVGLAGFAAWRWMVACRQEPTATARSIKTPTRSMAAASALFSIGYAVMAHITVQDHSSLGLATDPSFHYATKMICLISSGIGLLVAPIGFWLASLEVRRPTLVTEA